jgi:PIN domain nuclease of toxin-antitoxin system
MGTSIGKLIDAGVPDAVARDTVDLLNIEIVDFDAKQAVQAASLRNTTKRFGLSLGDRCCLALGTARKATILTSERTWSKLRIGLRVKVIR